MPRSLAVMFAMSLAGRGCGRVGRCSVRSRARLSTASLLIGPGRAPDAVAKDMEDHVCKGFVVRDKGRESYFLLEQGTPTHQRVISL